MDAREMLTPEELHMLLSDDAAQTNQEDPFNLNRDVQLDIDYLPRSSRKRKKPGLLRRWLK